MFSFSYSGRLKRYSIFFKNLSDFNVELFRKVFSDFKKL